MNESIVAPLPKLAHSESSLLLQDTGHSNHHFHLMHNPYISFNMIKKYHFDQHLPQHQEKIDFIEARFIDHFESFINAIKHHNTIQYMSGFHLHLYKFIPHQLLGYEIHQFVENKFTIAHPQQNPFLHAINSILTKTFTGGLLECLTYPLEVAHAQLSQEWNKHEKKRKTKWPNKEQSSELLEKNSIEKPEINENELVKEISKAQNRRKSKRLNFFQKYMEQNIHFQILSRVYKLFKSESEQISNIFQGLIAGVGSIFVKNATTILMSHALIDLNPSNHQFNILKYFLLSNFIKGTADFLSYPFELVKLKMMMQIGRKDKTQRGLKFASSLLCARKILHKRGVYGLFQGVEFYIAKKILITGSIITLAHHLEQNGLYEDA